MVKLIGFGGMVLGFVATQIANWTQERQMEQMIDEKLDKALAERTQENEES